MLTVDTPDIGADVVAGCSRPPARRRRGSPVPSTTGDPATRWSSPAAHWPALLATLHGDEGARRFLAARLDVVAVDCADLATGRDIDEA